MICGGGYSHDDVGEMIAACKDLKGVPWASVSSFYFQINVLYHYSHEADDWLDRWILVSRLRRLVLL